MLIKANGPLKIYIAANMLISYKLMKFKKQKGQKKRGYSLK